MIFSLVLDHSHISLRLDPVKSNACRHIGINLIALGCNLAPDCGNTDVLEVSAGDDVVLDDDRTLVLEPICDEVAEFDVDSRRLRFGCGSGFDLFQAVGYEVAKTEVDTLVLNIVTLLLKAVGNEVAKLDVDTTVLGLGSGDLINVNLDIGPEVCLHTYGGASHREGKSTCYEQGGDDRVLHDCRRCCN
jgi:hypothetical protein